MNKCAPTVMCHQSTVNVIVYLRLLHTNVPPIVWLIGGTLVARYIDGALVVLFWELKGKRFSFLFPLFQ